MDSEDRDSLEDRKRKRQFYLILVYGFVYLIAMSATYPPLLVTVLYATGAGLFTLIVVCAIEYLVNLANKD